MSTMHSTAKKAVDRSEGRGMNNLVDDYGRPTGKNGPDDPFADLLIDPDNVNEAKEYARQFYRTSRVNTRKAIIGIAATIAVATIPWLFPFVIPDASTRIVIALGSALAAFFLVNQIWKMAIASARSRRAAVAWQPWARSSLPLSAYLVTTSDPRRLWEAAGHQTMRDFVQKSIVHLNQYRADDLLTPARAEELSRYLQRDDELRAQIVELCDPTPGEKR
ncbi:hypothetical protein [Microbacterium maritypicum]